MTYERIDVKKIGSSTLELIESSNQKFHEIFVRKHDYRHGTRSAILRFETAENAKKAFYAMESKASVERILRIYGQTFDCYA